jgi:hypothetical protein
LLNGPPTPLPPSTHTQAATHRFLDVAELKEPAPLHEALLDNVLAAAHNTLTGVEPLRVAAGAGAGTRDAPARVTDYVPSEADVGGLLDDSKRAKRIYGKAGGGGGAGVGGGADAGGGGAGPLSPRSAAGAVAEAAAAAAAAQEQEQQQQQRKGQRRGDAAAAGAAALEPADEPAAASTDAAASEEAPAPRRRGWRRLRPMAAEAP